MSSSTSPGSFIYNAEEAQPYTASSTQPGYSIDSQQLYGIGTEPGYPSGHAVSALVGFRNIFGTNIDVGLQWEHVFSDNLWSCHPGHPVQAV